MLQVTGFGVNRPPLRDQLQDVGGSIASFGEGELALAERNPMDMAALLAAWPWEGALIRKLPKCGRYRLHRQRGNFEVPKPS
ncbi:MULTISPECIES: hypothetical protein [Pseudomonas aeruginosa group]|uniref:hypothetical protein n=1 Tax=Pseudomonas aeruginosa group TaxID=136841 RepID=UPI0009A281B4|nr:MULTISPECIES: hypothetical protein [Pseudomonas aeruginosa group]MDK2347635.1 hypothetical protein [Pseudomonas paraeruginosa]MEA8482329.1 hypothetical protein [Pseudomonas aeruginosa]